MKPDLRAQTLVIGSGAGGAVIALELAEAGMEVLVLEEGNRYGLTDYGASPPEAMKKLYRRRGMTPILGPVSIGYVEGCCVGGSTEINSGFWQRTPDETLNKWKSQYGLLSAGSKDLEPYFERDEQSLHVSVTGGDWPASTQVLARGMKALGWYGHESPRIALNCQDRNACACGCPSGAKQGMSRSLIPRAEAKGARIQPNCRVRSLVKDNSRISGVIAEQKNPDGSVRLLRIFADHIFVCAGATETPALLRRSGIKKNIGNSLSIHPMLKVVARFKEELDAEHSVMPLIQVKEFRPKLSMAGGFYTLGHLAMLLSDNWPQNRSLMKYRKHMAPYLAATRSTGKGFIRALPGKELTNLIWYSLTRQDLVHLSQGLARLSTLLLAAGALEVYPCVFGLPPITSEAQAKRWLTETLPRANLSLTTVHAFSTCPIGERREICAADSFGKIHDLDNLYLSDASMLPESPATNPQATIMALARRNALHFLEHK